ncbi:hypothetical protein D3C85_1891950 [compost metagenome]
MTFNLLYDKVNVHLLFWGVIVMVLAASYAVNQFVEKPMSTHLRTLLLRLPGNRVSKESVTKAD